MTNNENKKNVKEKKQSLMEGATGASKRKINDKKKKKKTPNAKQKAIFGASDATTE